MGWSLGGHIGIEMLPLLTHHHQEAFIVDTPRPPISVKGLMLVGAPPALGAEQMARAFKIPMDGLGFAGVTANWFDSRAEPFLRDGVAVEKGKGKGKKSDEDKAMLEDVKRTDARVRVMVAEAAMGSEASPPRGCDQKAVVETTDVLVAVVNGPEDQVVNLDYLDNEVRWKRLWRGECVRLAGLGHTPFWEDPKQFEQVLSEFLVDCEK